MDAFDLTDYTDLVPRRVLKVAALAFLVALAAFPPARGWYVHQAMVHGKHVADDIVQRLDLTTTTNDPPGPGLERVTATRRDANLMYAANGDPESEPVVITEALGEDIATVDHRAVSASTPRPATDPDILTHQPGTT
jgi:hypothetical protein